MFDAINTAFTGLTAANARLNTAATDIARFGSDNESDGNAPPSQDDDLPHDLVSLQTAQHLYTANAAVLRTADEMLGTLLDTVDNHPDRRRE
jgi:flagellar hook-associated protein FlgK